MLTWGASLLAYEFEKWPIRWVKLIMRMRPSQLHRLLAEAAVTLWVGWESLAQEERNCLEAISSAMDDSANIRVNQDQPAHPDFSRRC